MQEIFSAISNFGLPSVLSIYLLLSFETKISNLTTSISNLEKTTEKLLIKNS